MSKIMRVLTLSATTALIGYGRSCGPGWVVVDDARTGGSYQAYARQWVSGAWVAHDDPFQLNSQLLDHGLVWFADDDVYVASPYYVLHWDGSAWTLIWDAGPSYSALVSGITGLAPDVYWTVGGAGATHDRYFHWDGSSLTDTTISRPFGTGGSNLSIAGTAPLRGAGNRLLTLTGAGAGTLDPDLLSTHLTAYWQRDSTHGWAADDVAERVYYNGGTGWAEVTAPTYTFADYGVFYNAMHGTSDSDVWLVGSIDEDQTDPTFALLIQHWDGSAWTRHSIGGTAHLNVRALFDVYAVATNDVWVAGYTTDDSGVPTPAVWHWDGVLWTERPILA
jgi:hypothetical protein